MIEGSEKRICRLSFEFESPHVSERRGKENLDFEKSFTNFDLITDHHEGMYTQL